MPDIAVKVTDLHKDFVLPQHKSTSLKQAFVNIGKGNKKVQQRVLDGLSFEVNKGDFFGIVGRNGSGKSTLLKILAGVYSPTSGDVYIDGNLTPFIELGVGFNPELSGRDNVFLNGALLGFSRKEMNVMYDEIVEFAELSEFMDKKLKNYSSGMQVRLAFSIAIKAKNDILIFDEVLAVGDEAFQKKCLNVFEHHKASKQTVILVTHDMSTVKQFCNRAMLISEGKIVEIGDPRKVANAYSVINQKEIDRDVASNNKHKQSSQLSASIYDSQYTKKESFNIGEKIIVKLDFGNLAQKDIESIGVNIFKESGEHVTGINSRTAPFKVDWTKLKELELEFNLDITTGRYHIMVEAFSQPGIILDSLIDGPQFSVISDQDMQWSGLVEVSHIWRKKV